MTEDPRLRAARYRIGVDDGPADPEAPVPTAAQRAAYVETALQQAMRRGEFDDLPGAGKPLTDLLEAAHDPNWWIRRKIEREQLTGLAPPALSLRTEDAQLDARLDRLHRETDVRQVLEDFNTRVIEARRQLQGGPPVVTQLRDVDAEVAAWRDRRAQRQRVAEEAAARVAQEHRATPWWRRLRSRRSSR
jgi:hypothetical protein